jgi:hypothetical protein
MPVPIVKVELEFPYTRGVGPVIGAYLDGLEAGRLLGSRVAGRTLSPPLAYDPATGASVEDELVEIGPEGVITSWTWVTEPYPTHPLDRPASTRSKGRRSRSATPTVQWRNTSRWRCCRRRRRPGRARSGVDQ